MKYLCIRKCFFQIRLWEEGDILNWNEKTKPPRHFQPMEEKPVVVEVEIEESQIKTDEDIAKTEIESLRTELDAIGKPYDRRWAVARLEEALIIGKKERGIE